MLLRLAEIDDAIAVARVHVRSWQAGYRELLPDEYLRQLRPETWAEKYDFTYVDHSKPRTIVADVNDAILGFATTMPSRDPELPQHGELCALYVDPDHWGRGLGVTLVSAARAHLLGSGFHNAVLWLLAGNSRGERFYRHDGWAPDGVRKTDMVQGIRVQEIRYLRELTTSDSLRQRSLG